MPRQAPPWWLPDAGPAPMAQVGISLATKRYQDDEDLLMPQTKLTLMPGRQILTLLNVAAKVYVKIQQGPVVKKHGQEFW